MIEAALHPFEDPRIRNLLLRGRSAHTTTAASTASPHNLPFCLWFDDATRFYFIVDEKPKRVPSKGIKRIRNIAENPRVAIVIDHYEEDWSSLAYVLVHGDAAIVDDPDEYLLALRKLRDKYPQYRAMVLSPEKNPIVRIEARRVHAWGKRFDKVLMGWDDS
jgi:PPOX class probable F420-dependent enzyme